MSILTASGNDLDTVELRNMLDHWLSSPRIRHLVREKKILTEKKVDEVIAKDRAGLLDKGGLARVVRAILLNKDCRKHIVAMIVSKHSTENHRDMDRQLLRYAAEVKDLARMGASGLLTDAGQREPSKIIDPGKL